MDYGLTESDYWDMTLAEVIRHVESQKRQQKAAAQEKATFDYILADMIGRSVARIYSSTATMPQLHEAYSTLFDGAEIEAQKQEKRLELSVMRFKQFAQNHNKKLGGGAQQ